MNIDLDLAKVHLTKTSRTHACTEASDIGMRPGIDVPTTITVIKEGKRSVFHYRGTKRDDEGDVEEWSYRHTNPSGMHFWLTVFND